jgi:predicted transcriptional regulator of viral defense system
LTVQQERMRRRHGSTIARANMPAYEPADSVAKEQHYSTGEVAKLWGISPQTVRKIFGKVPGVLKIGTKGKYVMLQIPARILDAYHASMSQKSHHKFLRRLRSSRFSR